MAMQWQQRYADKLATAEEAVARIRRGDRVFVGSTCGEPQALVRALTNYGDDLTDTEIVQVLTLGVAAYAEPKYAARFRANAFFIGNSVRGAVAECRADYTPVFLSQVPALFRSRRVPIDASLICVSPPDEHGYCSYGVSVDITKAATESARLVIAQVNAAMPRTLGNSFIHVNQIHHLVDHTEPLLEWPDEEIDDVTRRIAEHVARLVPDGSTLQLGIGRIPDAVLSCLTNKHDLGIHTEMFSDGVRELAEAGVITGKRKTMHVGKIVGSFAAGSRKLFDFIDNNPAVEMRPSEYTNNPLLIARHDNIVAINSAIQVDLTGQVCADSIGAEFFSGLGGHADFMRGAAMAKNGRPIIAMPSTAGEGRNRVSRIRSTLAEGAGVITTRGDIHYVVTEYGIAYLHGRTMRDRAMALINVAHPDYRSELLHAAKRRHIVYANQIMPSPTSLYPAELETNIPLKSGQNLHVRPIKPTDEPQMKDMFYDFSERTVYLRYHATLKSMPHNSLQVFCNVDYETEMALVGLVEEDGVEEIVAVGRYMTEPGGRTAELAFVVRDAYQRRGIGTFLFQRLVKIARDAGIQKCTAEVLSQNEAMLRIFNRAGLPVQHRRDGDVIHVDIDLSDPAQGDNPRSE